MVTEEIRLSSEDKELVALGASVGAGCHPCFDYHLKAATAASLPGERLVSAVSVGERVATAARDELAAHVRARLGVDVVTSAGVPARDEALASLGAAIAANDRAGIERHMRSAVAAGVPAAAIGDAVELACTVQTKAAEIHQRVARRLVAELAPAPTVVSESPDGCGCGGPSAGTATQLAVAPARGGAS